MEDLIKTTKVVQPPEILKTEWLKNSYCILEPCNMLNRKVQLIYTKPCSKSCKSKTGNLNNSSQLQISEIQPLQNHQNLQNQSPKNYLSKTGINSRITITIIAMEQR